MPATAAGPLRRRAPLLMVLLAASAGCLANGDGSTGATGMTLTVDARSGTLAQGGSRSIKVTLTRNQGSVSDVALSVEDLPSGVTASLSPPLTLGTTSQITVTLQAGTVAPGTYTLTIRAHVAGLSDATLTYTLAVL